MILLPVAVGMGIGSLCGDHLRSAFKRGINEGGRVTRPVDRAVATLKEDIEDALAEVLAERSSERTE
jgi:hypothetical protein